MALLSSTSGRRSFFIQLLALVPTLLFCQVTIRERIELKPQPQLRAAGAAEVASTSLRFVFRSEYSVFLRMYIYSPGEGELAAYGTGEAVLILPDAAYGTYSFNLQLRVAELRNPIVGSAVTLDIYVGDSLARHDEGRITGGWYTIFGLWFPPIFYYSEPTCGDPPCGDPPSVSFQQPRDITGVMGTPSAACDNSNDLAWTAIAVAGEWFPGNTLDNFFSIHVCADQNDRKWVFNATSVGFAYATGFCEQNLAGKIDVGDGTGPNVDSYNYCEILKWLGKIDPVAHKPYRSTYCSRNVLQLHESFHLDRLIYGFRTDFFNAFRRKLASLSESISDCSEPASSVLERKRTTLEWEFDKLMKTFITSLKDDEEKVNEDTEVYFKGLANTIRTRASNESWPKCN